MDNGDMKKATVTLTIEYANHDLAHYHYITQARAYELLEQAIERQGQVPPSKATKWIWRWKISTDWQEIA
jgi:hypothetical protein